MSSKTIAMKHATPDMVEELRNARTKSEVLDVIDRHKGQLTQAQINEITGGKTIDATELMRELDMHGLDATVQKKILLELAAYVAEHENRITNLEEASK